MSDFHGPTRKAVPHDGEEHAQNGPRRGQLILQIAAGRFLRPDVEITETLHRRTVYTNCWFPDPASVELPLGAIIKSNGVEEIETVMIEATERLEKQLPDGTDDILVSTGGDELIDDIAYVMTFALNRTFSRNCDQMRRLVSNRRVVGRRRGAAGLFPKLFDSQQVIEPAAVEDVKAFMEDLLALSPEAFVRAMRAVRNSVDATRRAIDDPTGAYTDFVAALESLADDHVAEPITWKNYDGSKAKKIDTALKGERQELIENIHAAILDVEQAGATHKFVSSTLARVSPDYYRSEAVGSLHPPRSVELKQMLKVAYSIRSRRSHVLQDLGDEAWVFADGAETAFDPEFHRILTLAGLWRLVRHVTRGFVASAPKPEAEPWNYRTALPGRFVAPLAPRYWVWQTDAFDAQTAAVWFNSVAEMFIASRAGRHDEDINLVHLVEKIEKLVPTLRHGDAKTAMVGMYALWHDHTNTVDRRLEATKFLDTHGACLESPSPIAFTVRLLSNRGHAEWTANMWAKVATARRTARTTNNEMPLPAAVDALLQLETANQLQAAGRHDDAVLFASHAVEEFPGHEDLLAWEIRLVASDHDLSFSVPKFLFGTENGAEPAGQSLTSQPEDSPAIAEADQERDKDD